MTNAAGELVENSVVRFLPFGEYRPNSNQTASPTQLGYTGHKQNDDIGLIYMNARYYVPGIARFASADVIIPEPTVAQAFNRYSYVHNNPLNYIDPTGHCRYNDDGEYEFATDCTQEEFESLSWDDRIKWVEDFMEYTGVEWFYNIIGILAYFRDDVVWSNSVWASVSDAAVLRVIQDGWRVANGASSIGVENDATNAWKKFFVGEANGEDDHILLRLWGEAEQAGVDYGIDLAEPYISSIMEEAYIDSFVAFGNVYRWMIVGDVGYVNWDDYTNPIIAPMQFALDKALSGLTSWALDPRNPSSAVFVYGFGRSVISPLGANWALFKGAIRIWN